MKFLVFMKQVPDASQICFDNETKTLVREGVGNQINAYDRRAISEAIQRRNECGGEVIVATMGPPQAEEALAEAFLMGADRGIHVLDQRLAGSDTLATARVLAAVARKCGFDLIFCGQHSTDSETGQVPSELAELLGIPACLAVRQVEYVDRMVRVLCETDDGSIRVEAPLPAVLSAAERLIRPIKVKGMSPDPDFRKKITVWNLDDLPLPASDAGFEGSPTRVAEIRVSHVNRQHEVWDGSDEKAVAKSIIELVRRGVSGKKEPPQIQRVEAKEFPKYWIWMERSGNGDFLPVSLEMLSAVNVLVQGHGGFVCPIVTGNDPTGDDVALLSSYGAHQIYHLLSGDHPDSVVTGLCEQIQQNGPFALLFPATSEGRTLAPRIAARLQLGLTGDCVGLYMDPDGALVQLKPAFGGNLEAPIYSRTLPVMATIRPGALDLSRPASSVPIPTITWNSTHPISPQFKILSREPDSGAKAVQLDHADFIIGVGMGLGQENVSSAFRLAELLPGAVGGTRKVVDQGWLPRQYQIGLTGKFVAPRTYLGLGISGRYNHLIGVQKAGTIIAVNSDPEAEILKMADVGVVGDCRKILAEMLELLE